MANRLLIDQKCFKDDETANFKRSFDHWHQRALKIVDIHDEIISGRIGTVIFQVGLLPRDRKRLLPRALRTPSQSDRRDIDCGNFETFFGKK